MQIIRKIKNWIQRKQSKSNRLKEDIIPQGENLRKLIDRIVRMRPGEIIECELDGKI